MGCDNISKNKNNKFPKEFPFWARLKINKNRTTLVIDETEVKDKKKNKDVPGFVHRESIHVKDENNARKKGYEKIYPNPDKDDEKPMYLKKKSRLPKKLFKSHNKNLSMPNELKERYKKK